MKIHRFFVPQIEIVNNQFFIKQSQIVHQISRVLKLKVGEQIIVFIGDGFEYLLEIKSISKQVVDLLLINKFENETESGKSVYLYCSILKKENFEWVVQKTTELGIFEIFPIITSRTIKQSLNIKRLNTIAVEATEQSGRAIVPQVKVPISFEDALKEATENKQEVIIFNKGGTDELGIFLKDVALFVGPEGGWTDSEIELAKRYKVRFINLGKTTLRAETAAVAGTFLLLR